MGASPPRQSLHRSSRWDGVEASDSATASSAAPPPWSADSMELVAALHDGRADAGQSPCVASAPGRHRMSPWTSRPARWSDLPVGRRREAESVALEPMMSSRFIRRDGDARGIHYSNGTRGPAGDIRADGVVAGWHAGRLPQADPVRTQPWVKTYSRLPKSSSTLTSGGPCSVRWVIGLLRRAGRERDGRRPGRWPRWAAPRPRSCIATRRGTSRAAVVAGRPEA